MNWPPTSRTISNSAAITARSRASPESSPTAARSVKSRSDPNSACMCAVTVSFVMSMFTRLKLKKNITSQAQSFRSERISLRERPAYPHGSRNARVGANFIFWNISGVGVVLVVENRHERLLDDRVVDRAPQHHERCRFGVIVVAAAPGPQVDVDHLRSTCAADDRRPGGSVLCDDLRLHAGLGGLLGVELLRLLRLLALLLRPARPRWPERSRASLVGANGSEAGDNDGCRSG